MARERPLWPLLIPIVLFPFCMFICRLAIYSHQPITPYDKICSNCHRNVSMLSQGGQTCPHCGVLWSGTSESLFDGSGAPAPPFWGPLLKALAWGTGVLLVLLTILDYIFRTEEIHELWISRISWLLNATVFAWYPITMEDKIAGPRSMDELQSLDDSELTKEELQKKYGYVDGTNLFYELDRQ